jgi:hypothetical protein
MESWYGYHVLSYECWTPMEYFVKWNADQRLIQERAKLDEGE